MNLKDNQANGAPRHPVRYVESEDGLKIPLYDRERVDDLMAKGMRIIQREDAFRFGTDAVLLADFAAPGKGDRCVDLGTGTGILPLLMASRRADATFDAVEIQPDMAQMANRSVQLNGLAHRIRVHQGDLKRAAELLGYGARDLVVCNPPYSPEGTALKSADEFNRLARHEGGCSIEDVTEAAGKLLKNGGRLKMIYPSPRAFELMCAMRSSGLEPKRIRTVHAKLGRAPKFVLLEAMKGAGRQLHWMEPLVMADEDGAPSAEWKRIYRVGE